MTYQRVAIFDDNKVVTQICVVDTVDMDKWLESNLEIKDNFVIVGEHDEAPFIGYKWNKTKKTWIAPAPYSNWILDENNNWIPPIPKPIEDPKGEWFWHQDENSWIDIIHIPLEEQ